jgi:hypothetical protein
VQQPQQQQQQQTQNQQEIMSTKPSTSSQNSSQSLTKCRGFYDFGSKFGGEAPKRGGKKGARKRRFNPRGSIFRTIIKEYPISNFLISNLKKKKKKFQFQFF